MASGKIRDTHFRMTLNDGTEQTQGQGDYKYLDWFTPASGFTVTQATLRHVERNVWYLYINGHFDTDEITAYAGKQIGSIVKSYFGNVGLTAYVPALCSAIGTGVYRAGVAQFGNAGTVIVSGANNATGSVIVNGLLITREV